MGRGGGELERSRYLLLHGTTPNTAFMPNPACLPCALLNQPRLPAGLTRAHAAHGAIVGRHPGALQQLFGSRHSGGAALGCLRHNLHKSSNIQKRGRGEQGCCSIGCGRSGHGWLPALADGCCAACPTQPCRHTCAQVHPCLSTRPLTTSSLPTLGSRQYEPRCMPDCML